MRRTVVLCTPREPDSRPMVLIILLAFAPPTRRERFRLDRLLERRLGALAWLLSRLRSTAGTRGRPWEPVVDEVQARRLKSEPQQHLTI